MTNDENDILNGQSGGTSSNESIDNDLTGKVNLAGEPPIKIKETTSEAEAPTPVNSSSAPSGMGREPENKKKIPILAIVVLVALVVGVFAVYKIYRGLSENPTDIIKKVIDNTYEEFSSNLKKVDEQKGDIDIMLEPVKIKGELEFNDKSYEGLDKEKVTFELGLDYKNKLASGMGSVLRDGTSLGDAAIYLKDDKLYMKSNTFFDNIYLIGEQRFDELFDFSDLVEINDEELPSVEDIDYVVKEFKDILVNSLDSKKMIKDKVSIDINGKTVSVDKITYKIDAESTKNLANALIDNTVKNASLIKKLAEMTGASEDEIKNSLNESKVEDTSDLEDIDSDFVIYTKGIKRTVVGLELTSSEGKIVYSNYEDDMKIVIEMEGFKVEVNSVKKKETYEIEALYNGQKVASLTVREANESKIDLDYDINIEGVRAKGLLKIAFNNVDSKKADGGIRFTLDGEADGEEFGYSLDLSFDLVGGEELEDIDTRSALEDFTQEDTVKMSQKMVEFSGSSLYKYFAGSIEDETMGDYPFDDYDM